MIARAAAAPEIKLLAEPPRGATPEGSFEGYASLFGVADLGRDIVMPGAFADSLTTRGAAGIRMLCPSPDRSKCLKSCHFDRNERRLPQHLPQHATRTGANGRGLSELLGLAALELATRDQARLLISRRAHRDPPAHHPRARSRRRL